jgi:hypothetical protein
MKELDRVYAAGQIARKQMLAKGEPVDGKTCDNKFVAIGEDQYNEPIGQPKEFIDLRKVYFRNGCLDIPKPGQTPTTASTGASSAATTTGNTVSEKSLPAMTSTS